MANILTKEQLIALNDRMLQRGAPVTLDGVGYNKFDFDYMDTIDTDWEQFCFRVAKTLKKYSHTQLPEIADVIDDTITAYKPTRNVQAVTHDEFGIGCTTSYCTEFVDYLRTLQKNIKHRWVKGNDGKFTLFIAFEAVGEIADKMDTLGFDTTQLRDYTETATTSPVETTVLVECWRTDIDTVRLKFDFHKELVDLVKATETAWFDKGSKAWELDLNYLYDLCKRISASGIKLNSPTMKEWCLKMKHTNSYTLKDFDYSHLRFQPYPHQIEDARIMLAAKKLINANEMGTGKTFESVIMGGSIKGNKIIVCPPTLRINWLREIRMMFPQADVEIIYNSDEPRLTAEWTIMGYPTVAKRLNALVSQDIAALFVDEAHYIQAINNYGKPESDRAKAVLYLAKTIEYAYPITGTPKTNRNKNLFNVLRMVNHPLTQGRYAFGDYGKRYCDGQNNGYGWDYEGNSNDNELHELIKPYMVRHLKRDVMPNIKKQRIFVPVEVDLREYHMLISEYLNSRTNKEAEQLARLMKARHVLSTQKASDSIEMTRDMLNNGEQVVMVTCFLDTLATFQKAFKKNNCVVIKGGMSDQQKDDAVQAFQSGKAQVLVMQIVAGGVGLTMTASHNMVVNDMPWTPGELVQAEDRLARGGQVHEYSNIHIPYAVGADMDEVLVDTLDTKMDSINAAIDGGDGESFDMRVLIENAIQAKANGVDWHHQRDALTTKKVKAPKAAKSDVKAVVENVQTIVTIDYSKMDVESLEKLAVERGVAFKTYDNAGIHRMRLIMALKKG